MLLLLALVGEQQLLLLLLLRRLIIILLLGGDAGIIGRVFAALVSAIISVSLNELNERRRPIE